MVLVFKWAGEDSSREWELEEHFCLESLECWWEESHRIVGFEFDEKEDICPVSAWLLEHTVAYGSWDTEELFCDWCDHMYRYHHDRYRDFEIVGYKHSSLLQDARQLTYFDLKNGLHLLSWW